MQQRRRPGGRAPRAGDRPPRAGNRASRAGDRGRGSARPAAARRGGAQVGAAKRTRAPEPHRFTGRAVVLSLVLLGLLLAYAYPVRVYLTQQAEISALEDQQASQ